MKDVNQVDITQRKCVAFMAFIEYIQCKVRQRTECLTFIPLN